MDEWYAPKSNVRIALCLVLIIAGFAWILVFFKFVSFSPQDRLTGWLGAIIAGFFFFWAFCIGFSVKTKKILVGTLVCFSWSMGFLIIPVPEGYAETVYGSWAIVLIAIVAIYAKYKESRKKKNVRLGKETEK